MNLKKKCRHSLKYTVIQSFIFSLVRKNKLNELYDSLEIFVKFNVTSGLIIMNGTELFYVRL